MAILKDYIENNKLRNYWRYGGIVGVGEHFVYIDRQNFDGQEEALIENGEPRAEGRYIIRGCEIRVDGYDNEASRLNAKEKGLAPDKEHKLFICNWRVPKVRTRIATLDEKKFGFQDPLTGSFVKPFSEQSLEGRTDEDIDSWPYEIITEMTHEIVPYLDSFLKAVREGKEAEAAYAYFLIENHPHALDVWNGGVKT